MSLSFSCPYRCVFCVPVRDIPCPQWCEFSPRSSPTGGLRDALADLSLPLRALLHAVAGEDGQPVLHVHPVHRPHQISRERPHVRAEETQRLVQLLHAGVAQRAEAGRSTIILTELASAFDFDTHIFDFDKHFLDFLTNTFSSEKAETTSRLEPIRFSSQRHTRISICNSIYHYFLSIIKLRNFAN